MASPGLRTRLAFTTATFVVSLTAGTLLGESKSTRLSLKRHSPVATSSTAAAVPRACRTLPITELRATGGGSRSDAIVQMTADIFGLPVRRPATPETSILGAAMDAAVGMKLYPDVAAAVRGMAQEGDLFAPNPETEGIYRDLYERVYRKTYDRLMPLNREIQKITAYPPF